jgi:hypothetical protein
VFPDKTVRPILKSQFIEARLHTDKTEDSARFEFNDRILELRDKFVGEGNIAIPAYYIVDPETETVYGAHKGLAAVAVFVDFFNTALERAGRGKAGNSP